MARVRSWHSWKPPAIAFDLVRVCPYAGPWMSRGGGMADAVALGATVREDVQVRLLSPAPDPRAESDPEREANQWTIRASTLRAIP